MYYEQEKKKPLLTLINTISTTITLITSHHKGKSSRRQMIAVSQIAVQFYCVKWYADETFFHFTSLKMGGGGGYWNPGVPAQGNESTFWPFHSPDWWSFVNCRSRQLNHAFIIFSLSTPYCIYADVHVPALLKARVWPLYAIFIPFSNNNIKHELYFNSYFHFRYEVLDINLVL